MPIANCGTALVLATAAVNEMAINVVPRSSAISFCTVALIFKGQIPLAELARIMPSINCTELALGQPKVNSLG